MLFIISVVLRFYFIIHTSYLNIQNEIIAFKPYKHRPFFNLPIIFIAHKNHFKSRIRMVLSADYDFDILSTENVNCNNLHTGEKIKFSFRNYMRLFRSLCVLCDLNV